MDNLSYFGDKLQEIAAGLVTQYIEIRELFISNQLVKKCYHRN